MISGLKSTGDYNDMEYYYNSVLRMVNEGHVHFEPLLDKNKILENKHKNSSIPCLQEKCKRKLRPPV